MGLIGKGASSLRKKDVVEQKTIALGFKKMVFAHKANAGETGINLTALITPTEMSTNGFVNPSVGDLTRININQFKNNLKLVSTLSGLLMPYVSYVTAGNSQINFIGFTAAQDEIFVGYIDEAPTTSLTVVDGKPIVASGVLLAGQTDFNIGMPIPINQNASTQIGAVMVFADRGLQYRKVGNNISGDGDYIEVPVAGGLGSLIKFDASVNDRFITVVSNGVVAERPDGSMTAMIERVQGQVDQMVPTLAALTGLPETTWQTAPNDVDLKQFGDQVITNTNDIATLTPYIGENLSALRQYNLTVTDTNWTTTRAIGVPYLTLDGVWRLRFNIVGAYGAPGSSLTTLIVAGITTASGRQTFTAYADDGSVDQPINIARISGSSNVMNIRAVSYQAVNTIANIRNLTLSGDIELAAKPTFVP